MAAIRTAQTMTRVSSEEFEQNRQIKASIRCCLTKTNTKIMELSSATSKKARVMPKMSCLYNPEKKIVFFVIKWDEHRDNFSIEVLVQAECVRWQLGFNKNSLGKATTKSGIAFTLGLELVWNCFYAWSGISLKLGKYGLDLYLVRAECVRCLWLLA